ncbi:MAG: hypothetical protein DSZ33_05095 [Gammaproteobacteria bacterium]|nr:MAG: hypothetical protein DSZ33_05095 [Gammaproteobacteria bacterium]
MISTVCVYDGKGRPVKNKKVEISIPGVLSGGMAHGFTDSSGCSNISHSARGVAKIYVGGSQVGRFTVPGRTTVTI